MQTATYTAAQTATNTAPTGAARIWTGRVISGIAALFLFFDGATKAIRLPAVVEASAQFGLSADAIFGIGVVLLASLALYLIPRTAPLGATLLTGFLGGAIAAQVVAGSPVFNLTFPLILGAMLWGGLALRDRRARALLSL